MPLASLARLLPLALLLSACGHPAAATVPPETMVRSHEPAAPITTPDPAPAPAASPTQVTQVTQVTFADDADPEPTTMVQGAPVRPPMPRFKLFGTREGDGPN